MTRPGNTLSIAEFRSRAPAGKARKPRREPAPMPPRAELLTAWDAILSAPPRRRGTERREPTGVLVCRWSLPLELCQPVNRLRRMPAWRYGQVRADLLALMRAQLTAYGMNLRAPLGGRPLVRCVRFSPVESDPESGWTKQVLDLMQPTRWKAKVAGGPKHPIPGLALVWNDSSSDLARACWCEPCSRGQSGCLVELWTGEP